MKSLLQTLAIYLLASTPGMAVMAAGGTEKGGLLVALFLGFAALIILLQVVPAIILFASMIHALFFTPEEESAAPVQDDAE